MADRTYTLDDLRGGMSGTLDDLRGGEVEEDRPTMRSEAYRGWTEGMVENARQGVVAIGALAPEGSWLGKKARAAEEVYGEEAENWRRPQEVEEMPWYSPTRIVGSTAGAAASMVPALTVGGPFGAGGKAAKLVGAAASSAIAGFQEAESFYRQRRAEGIGEKEALREAAIAFPLIAGLNAISFRRIIGRVPGRFATGLWEAATEIAEEPTQALIAGKDPIEATITGMKEVGPAAFLLGAFLGAGGDAKMAKKIRGAIESDPEGFDNILATQPEAVTAASEQMKEIDPKLAKYLEDRVKKFVTASDKDLDAIGRRSAEDTLKRKQREHNKALKELEPPTIEQRRAAMQREEAPASQERAVVEPSAARSEEVFYSPTRKVVETAPMEKGQGAQWLGWLLKNGGRVNEIKWIGLDEWLKSNKNVTKEQVLEYLDANRMTVKDVDPHEGQVDLQELADELAKHNITVTNDDYFFEAYYSPQKLEARFNGNRGDYQILADGRPLPEYFSTKAEAEKEIKHLRWAGGIKLTDEPNTIDLLSPEAYDTLNRARDASNQVVEDYEQWTTPGGSGYRTLLLQVSPRKAPQEDFIGPHYPTPNVVARVRWKERAGPNGERVFAIEELQDDWQQAGREYGYQQDYDQEIADGYLDKLRTAEGDTADIVGANLNTFAGILTDGSIVDILRLYEGPDAPLNSLEVLSDSAAKSYIKKAAENTAIEQSIMRRLILMLDTTGGPVENEADTVVRLTSAYEKKLEYYEQEYKRTGVFGPRGYFPRVDVETFRDALYDTGLAAKLTEMEKARRKLYEYSQRQQGVPDAPFKTTWRELGFRRVFRWAAENGFDAVTWTKGETQSERYGGYKPKLIKLYNEIIPREVEKLIKPWGGKVEKRTLPLEREVELGYSAKVAMQAISDLTNIHYVKITPEMKQAVMRPQPLNPMASPGGRRPARFEQLSADEVFDRRDRKLDKQWERARGDSNYYFEGQDRKGIAYLAHSGWLTLSHRQEFATELERMRADWMASQKGPVEGGAAFTANAADVVRAMAASTTSPELRAILQAVAPFTKNATVVFEDSARIDAYYNGHDRTIHIGYVPGSEYFAPALFHEAIHSATSHFLSNNPHHKLTKQMRSLVAEARLRARRMAKDRGDFRIRRFYGMANEREFVAELFSSSQFFRFLVQSEKYASPKWKTLNLLHRVSDLFRQMFKLAPEHSRTIYDAISLGMKVMEAQSRDMDVNSPGVISPAALGEAQSEAAKELTQIHTAGPSGEDLSKIPGVKVVQGKLAQYQEWFLRNFVPEGLSPEAKRAGAHIASWITRQKAWDAQMLGKSKKRRSFWNKNMAIAMDFLEAFETGGKFQNPGLEKVAQAYRAWMDRLAVEDKALGIKYRDQDNYLTHLFKRPDQVREYMNRKYGRKWGDPYFIKRRSAATFKELVEKGFEPVFDNPEDIFMARQHASNIAHMQIGMLRNLAEIGLAVKLEKDEKGKVATKRPDGFAPQARRSPNGELFYIHKDAQVILEKAFDTPSLWNMEGPAGDLFRAGMLLKNHTIPITLFGFFHAVHVGAMINNAAALTRASKNILSGKTDPKYWLKDIAKGLLPASGLWDKSANRVLKAYWGKIPLDTLTDSERVLMVYMQEGGLVPGLAQQDILGAMGRLRTALERQDIPAAMKSVFSAVLETIQYPMFHIWIPTMKIGAYAKDVATALTVDPSLIQDPVRRVEVLRKLAKSTDNRFGEMPYDTLFWDKRFKDFMVLNTLSVGWQMGFIREYGGGVVEAAKAPFTKGSLREKAKTGQIDRALFATYYVALGMAYTGLLSYFLSGEPPEDLDYFYPRSGETDPDGKPKRLNTPFFTREFASIYKHMQNEGVVGGLTHLVMNKASGVIGLTTMMIAGVDGLGREIRDPESPAYKQVLQTINGIWEDIQPISYAGMENIATGKGTSVDVLEIGGFSPAPKYATQTRMQGEVKSMFQKYFGAKRTPYEKAVYSDAARKLREAADNRDPEYYKILREMQTKFDLTPTEIRRLQTSIQRREDPFLRMFARLPWQRQKMLLDKHWHEMEQAERQEYLRHANKEHLRYSYQPPRKH